MRFVITWFSKYEESPIMILSYNIFGTRNMNQIIKPHKTDAFSEINKCQMIRYVSVSQIYAIRKINFQIQNVTIFNSGNFVRNKI